MYEVLVDFTKDYGLIRQALTKVEHYNKTCLFNMLQAANSIFSSNWGNQNYCQIIMITDCGIGLGQSSLKNIISGMTTSNSVEKVQPLPLPFVHSKVSVLCLGNITDDYGFKYGKMVYTFN